MSFSSSQSFVYSCYVIFAPLDFRDLSFEFYPPHESHVLTSAMICDKEKKNEGRKQGYNERETIKDRARDVFAMT